LSLLFNDLQINIRCKRESIHEKEGLALRIATLAYGKALEA
jgi:hypothetical protein